MAGVNRIHLIGNVGQEPEIRHTQNGAAIANFSLATTEHWTKDDQKQEKTQWHNCSAFGKIVESVIAKYVNKGTLLYVEGSIDYQQWEKDGQKHYRTVIKVRDIQLLGGKSSGQQQSAPASGGDFDENIPF